MPVTDDSLRGALRRRRTTRSFTSRPLGRSELGFVLDTIRRTKDSNPYPSGGAMFPVRTVVLARTRDAWTVDHELSTGAPARSTISAPEVNMALRSGSMTAGSYLLVLCANHSEHEEKYGAALARRLGLIEVGHIAQNIQLASALRGIGVMEYAGFDIERLCQVVTPFTDPALVLALGWPSKSPARDDDDRARAFRWARCLAGALPALEAFDRVVEPDDGYFGSIARTRSRCEERPIIAGGKASLQLEARLLALAELNERVASECVAVDTVLRRTRDQPPPEWRQLAEAFDLRIDPDGWLLGHDASPREEFPCRLARRGKSKETIPVPIELVYYPLRRGDLNDAPPIRRSNSSGVASGRSRSDSVRRAYLELIERDGLLSWWHFGSGPPILSPPPDSFLEHRAKNWTKRGYRLLLLDLTVDCGTVVAAAIMGDDWPRASCGSAAGPSRSTLWATAERAVREAEATHSMMLRHEPLETWATASGPVDHGRAHAGSLELARWIEATRHSITDDLAWESATDRFSRTRPIVVELTSPINELCVTRVLDPTLLQLDFGPLAVPKTGDVLRRLGRIGPINPIPHFLT